jgi:hypothetical protein
MRVVGKYPETIKEILPSKGYVIRYSVVTYPSGFTDDHTLQNSNGEIIFPTKDLAFDMIQKLKSRYGSENRKYKIEEVNPNYHAESKMWCGKKMGGRRLPICLAGVGFIDSIDRANHKKANFRDFDENPRLESEIFDYKDITERKKKSTKTKPKRKPVKKCRCK